MNEDRTPGQPLPGEDEEDRSQRQMGELMTEVRIVMPGVQVLFAFLLTVPFQASFDETTDTERVLYVLTLLSAGLASACLIASAALHRVLFGLRERDFIILTGNRLVLVGLVALAVAMSCATGMVISFLWSPLAGWLSLAGGMLLFSSLWFLLPLARRAKARSG